MSGIENQFMVTIGIPILVSFGCALFVSVLILTTKSIHGRFSFDSNTTDIHKYHNLPTPRIGGIAFLFGLVVRGRLPRISGGPDSFAS